MAEQSVAGQARLREYETIYVLRPDVTAESAAKIASRVEEVVTREAGKLTLVETWGRRQLAYPVTKFKRGVYLYVKYLGKGGIVTELERNLKMLDDVLKYQTVKVRDEVEEGGVEINPDDVKFEEIQPPGEDEVEESRERALGLDESAAAERRREYEDDVEEGSVDALGDDEEDS
jgi:small subunit ribosomal protein S6